MHPHNRLKILGWLYLFLYLIFHLVLIITQPQTSSSDAMIPDLFLPLVLLIFPSFILWFQFRKKLIPICFIIIAFTTTFVAGLIPTLIDTDIAHTRLYLISLIIYLPALGNLIKVIRTD